MEDSMKTVVTGGNGFVGSHLVKRLVEEGREVVVASDFSQMGNDNLSNLGIQPSDIRLLIADLTGYHQALEATEGADTVFHLAARVGSLEYLHGTKMAELATLQANLLIDANTFRACLENKVRNLIYASSVAVYSMDSQESPGAVFSEKDLALESMTYKLENQTSSSINPDGGYGWSKLIGEIQLHWMNGINIGIARIFNIYGENEPLGERAHVVADLISRAILDTKEEFTVHGDGQQSRDFLYVSDCVNALLRLEEKASNPPITVNIGSGKAVSIGTIAQKAVELSGKGFKIIYDSNKPAGPLSRTADTGKAKALLGWKPRIDLEEGLKHTYFWAARILRGETLDEVVRK